MQLSLILGKSLVGDDVDVGKIDGIAWQKGQCCLLVVGEEFLSADRVKIKENVIGTNLHQVQSLPLLCLGKNVYDTTGNLLGKIVDVQLTSTLRLQSLVLENGMVVKSGKIVGNNDIVTVRTNKPKRVQATLLEENNTASKMESSSGQKLQHLEKGNLTPQVATTEQSQTIAPRRKSGDFFFLVGKTVDKNIFNFLGELMIKEGEIVTRAVYLRARYFGKLTELCLHTK